MGRKQKTVAGGYPEIELPEVTEAHVNALMTFEDAVIGQIFLEKGLSGPCCRQTP